MTTARHTPIETRTTVPGIPANAATFNAPLSQLDTAIGTVEAQADLLLASMGAGTGWASSLDGTAASGQKVVPVASTTGAVAGMPVYIGLTSATHEVGVIDTISAGVSVTLLANLTSTYAAGTPISATPAEIADARGGKATVGARISLIEGRVFDVMASPYNAVGDHTTDDRAAIQAAIDAASAAGGGTVLLTRLYRIAAELTIRSGVSIVGLGDGAGLTAPPETVMSLIRGTGVANCVVSNLLLDGNKTVHNEAWGPGLDGVTFVDASVNCVVSGCHVARTARDGISFRSSSGCAAIGNFIELVNEEGIMMRDGTAHRAIGNYIKSFWGDGINLSASDRCTVAGNTLDQDGYTDPAVNGGGLISTGSYNTITGNTVIGAHGNTFYASGSHFGTFTGNTLRNGYTGGFYLENCSDNVVTGNVVDTMAVDGIIITGTDPGSHRNIVANNSISHITGTGIVVISGATYPGLGNRVSGNRINVVSVHGIYVETPDVQIEGNRIAGVTVADMSGIKAVGVDVSIRGNRVVAPKSIGIWLTGNRGVISDNEIASAGARGLQVSSSVNGTCHGNHVRNSGIDGTARDGIIFMDCADWAITGNRSYDDQAAKTQTYGIRSTGTSDWLVVSGNSCRGNATASVTLVGANNQVTGANT